MERLAIAAGSGSIGGEPPKEILLLSMPKWQLIDMSLGVDAQSILAEFRRHKTDLVIDYDHQTLKSPDSGTPAPAAGWISDLRVDANGVWGTDIRWTEKAADFIRKGEYRYFSPVALYDEQSQTVRAIESVALTNIPRTNNQTPLTARAAASLIEKFQQERGGEMKWFQLLKATLDRAANTTPAEVLADLKKVIASLEATGAEPAGSDAKTSLAATLGFVAGGEIPNEVLTILGLEKGTPMAKVQASLLTLKNPPDKVDKAEHDKVVARITELEGKLDAASKTSDIDKLVAANRSKISPAMEKTVRAIAAANFDQAKAIVAELPTLVGSEKAKNAPDLGTEEQEAAEFVVIDDKPMPVDADSSRIAASCRAIMKEKASKGESCTYAEANEIRKQRDAAAA
jgi:phage I-like protein